MRRSPSPPTFAAAVFPLPEDDAPTDATGFEVPPREASGVDSVPPPPIADDAGEVGGLGDIFKQPPPWVGEAEFDLDCWPDEAPTAPGLEE